MSAFPFFLIVLTLRIFADFDLGTSQNQIEDGDIVEVFEGLFADSDLGTSQNEIEDGDIVEVVEEQFGGDGGAACHCCGEKGCDGGKCCGGKGGCSK